MKNLYIFLTLISFSLSAQQKEFYKFADTSKKYTVKYFKDYFAPYEKGIIFFYPNDDSLKKIDFETQIVSITKDPRFKNAKILGVPYKTGVKDEDNVYFEKHIVTNTECLVYSKDSLSVNKALKNESNFNKKTKDIPSEFYLIDISKESICVKEKRIEFCKAYILEFLDPTLTQNDIIKDLTKRMVILESQTNHFHQELDAKNKLIEAQTKRIETLENDLKTFKTMVELKPVKKGETKIDEKSTTKQVDKTENENKDKK